MCTDGLSNSSFEELANLDVYINGRCFQYFVGWVRQARLNACIYSSLAIGLRRRELKDSIPSPRFLGSIIRVAVFVMEDVAELRLHWNLPDEAN